MCQWGNHNSLREVWLIHGASFRGLSIACDFAEDSECLNICIICIAREYETSFILWQALVTFVRSLHSYEKLCFGQIVIKLVFCSQSHSSTDSPVHIFLFSLPLFCCGYANDCLFWIMIKYDGLVQSLSTSGTQPISWAWWAGWYLRSQEYEFLLMINVMQYVLK